MKLYQGTNVHFDTIDLSKSMSNKDFGKGFYLTTIYEQAKKFAERRTKSFGGIIIIQSYEFDENIRYGSSLNIRETPLSSAHHQ